MPSENTLGGRAFALTALYVVAVLLYGYFILGQILLSVLIALVGVIVYLAWRFLRLPDRNNGL